MRNPGIVAFGITLGIFAPVVMHVLGAGPAQREMMFAPSASALDINGVHIDAELDRRMVDPGETVHLDLSAPNRIEVGVVVFGSSGDEGSRVPSPPSAVMHKTVTLEPNKVNHVAIKLHGARAGYQAVGSYTIYVMSPKAADKLAAAQAKAGPSYGGSKENPIPDMDTDTQKLFSLMYKIGNDDLDEKDAKLFGAASVARLEAYTRVINPAVSIVTPETGIVDGKISVGVVLKNTTKHAQQVKVSLTAPRIDNDLLVLGNEAMTTDAAEEDVVIDLKAGETKRVDRHVTAKTKGVLGLSANVSCVGEARACYEAFRSGAIDAIQILPAQPAVAAK
jgi:hypothetical protein